MDVKDIIKPENRVYAKSPVLTNTTMHYCPGCSHGAVHKLIAEVIDEMGIQEQTIGVSPVGCAVFAYNYIDIDWQQAAHGRAPALATATKRLHPEKYVFTYQGDGDLASIGTAEIIHACNRGENIVVIFINNAIYGMTGGQMAPTTLIGMKTATSPYGRTVALHGNPLKITELIAQLDGTCYVTRQSVQSAAAARKTPDRKQNVLTSLALDSAIHEKLNHTLQAKYKQMCEEDVRFETIQCDDAKHIIVAYGCMARICESTIEMARKDGIKLGLLRPITLICFNRR